jgi:uncharacterized protein YbjT (DUF2867 family)
MILITGATGNIGRALATDLDARAATFRILTRDPARAVGMPQRAQRVVGDLGQAATLAPAFAGVEKLFLLTPGITVDHAAAAVAAAKAAEVRHVVLLSAFTVLGDPMPAMGHWHHAREEIVRASGIPSTLLRPGGFMTNALDWAPAIREGGPVIDPTGPGRYAPIDPLDIAAVAALVLTEDGHQGEAYVLTGEETFTVAEQVAIIGRSIGREIEVREAASAAEAVRSRFPNGAAQQLADAIIEGFALMRGNTVGFRTDTLERLLGRKPRTFADWCARNAHAFERNPRLTHSTDNSGSPS